VTLDEFQQYESYCGSPLKLTLTLRISLPMNRCLENYAKATKTGKSKVLRQAIFEYLGSRMSNATKAI